MEKNIVSEEELKKALNITKFSEMSKEKIKEFVSLLPNTDKEIAISAIGQFPSFASMSTSVISELNSLCDSAFQTSDESNKEAINAYKFILETCNEQLKSENLSEVEKNNIIDKMIEVADKISAKDTEHKNFLENVIKYSSYVTSGALILAAAILGVNITKGRFKLPQTKK